VIGDQLHEGMKVAVPGKNDGSARRRHFGLSLF
jgi:hypothetical protein